MHTLCTNAHTVHTLANHMKYSLPSRDLIADCIELMHEGYLADAMITLGGCDKVRQ